MATRSPIDITNIVARYDRLATTASYADRREACLWYPKAQDVARDMMAMNPCLIMESACAIISAFSPRNSWAVNVRYALSYASGIRPKCLGMSLRMADAAMVDGFAALKGPKVNAFARAIAGDDNAVVIDAHMARAADCDSDGSVTIREYRACADAVRAVASAHGWQPSAMQALIWIAQRGKAY